MLIDLNSAKLKVNTNRESVYVDLVKDAVKLKEKEAEIINFYPVVDGKIELGDTSKYISSATKLTTINIAELHNLTKI